MLALALSFGLSACRPAPPADLVILNGTEPETIDPAIITGQPEGRVVTALFEGLTRNDPATARAIPGVAERWEISPEGTVYTFHLRRAQWSNGDPLTAHDFVWSWQRTLAPATASEYAYLLFHLVNAERYNSGELTDFAAVGVRALDEDTLEVRLQSSTPFFLDLCAFPTLYPVHRPSVERWPEDWLKPGRLVSNGAYQLETWRINDRLRLRRNPRYWNAANVALETVDLLPVGSPQTAINLYLTGAADIIWDKGLIPTYLLEELRSYPDCHTFGYLGSYFYRFNCTRPPFDDVRVRQALTLAVDRERLVTKITKGGEKPATHFTPPGIPGYDPPAGLGHDPDRARSLLAEAGYPGGRGFPKFKVLFNKAGGGAASVNEQIAIEIREMWRQQLGIKCDLENQEWKVYLNSMSALDYDVCRSSWIGDYNDPNTFLDMFVTGGGNNRTGWSLPRYDELIRAAGQTLDPPRRAAIFAEAERILCRDELPVLPLYFYVGVTFYDPAKWTGIHPNVLDVHPVDAIRRRGAETRSDGVRE
ncbi:peptide ABC transporter substrate-binding protein [bacterium]|nr:peptide ABC transporter substrate-binding protein [bacterium]